MTDQRAVWFEPQASEASADVELTDEDLARIHAILPAGAYGARYPETMLPQW